MKIVFTGGGTGGHFYPIIAVAEAVRTLCEEQQLVTPRLFYLAPQPFDEAALYDNGIEFIKSPAGKMRRYADIRNFFDIFTTLGGTVWCLIHLFRLYPDVIFSKGGYASVPTVLAARILGIPIVIHESDAKPGRANLLASKSALRIAVAFPSAAEYFPAKVRDRIAETGIPIRRALGHLDASTAEKLLSLDSSVPTVLILGGSSGSKRINDMVLGSLTDFVSFANVIHQTGKALFSDVEATSRVTLEGNAYASRYHPFAYLSAESLREAAGAADLVISRAGSTAIAEIALWHKPSILIPIPEKVSHDQRMNAYAYAHTGAAIVLEEENMTPHVLASEAKRIVTDAQFSSTMATQAGAFARADAATIIAQELLTIALSHEPDKVATPKV